MFTINGINWNLIFVNNSSPDLLRSDGTTSLAVTDWNSRSIFVSTAPKGAYLRRIIAHELCHAFCFSYDISMPIEQEEYLAGWISLYGTDLVYLLDNIMSSLSRRAV
jgi:hypothetical protein